MIAPMPATIAYAVLEEINAHLVAARRFLEPSDPLYMGWLDKVERLPEEFAGARALVMASAAQVVGDVHRLEHFIAIARRADAPRQAILETQLVGYANLAYASKANGAFRQAVDIRNGNISSFIHIGLSIGALQRMQELIDQARRANISLEGVSALRGFEGAAEILRAQSFSDEDCAKVIDAAGEVLRARSLFWLDSAPQVIADEGQALVLLRYRIDVTPIEAANACGELVEKLIARGLDTAPLVLTFVGAAA